MTPPEPPSVSIPLPDGARFEVWHGRHFCATVYADGTAVPARPHDTPEYRATADALGYTGPRAGWAMCVFHELTHSLLAAPAPSPVLWALAHGEPADGPEHYAEEGRVLDAQRALTGLLQSFRAA